VQQALDDLLQVGLALAQVLVLHLVELARDHFQLGGQRPLGVVETLDDPVLDAAGQHFVLQQHQVHLEQRGELMRCVVGAHQCHTGLQLLQLLGDRVARDPNAVDLGFDLFRLDEVVGDVEAARDHEHGASDRNATGHGQPMDGKSHSPSPNLSFINATMASIASCSRSPSVSISTVTPMPAASIITPMMLLAFTRRSPRDSQTSQG
jgi:hypothetical protein